MVMMLSSSQMDPTSDQPLSPKRRRASNDASGDSDSDNLRPSHGPGRPHTSPTERFMCPFAKLDPAISGDHRGRACCGPGWVSTHRVKEHLYRCHLTFVCDRCFVSYGTKDALMDHRRNPEPCQIMPTPERERMIIGIDECKEKGLRKRRKGMSEYAKWYDIWKVLFPTIPAPKTPYYEESPFELSDTRQAVSHVILNLGTDLLEVARSAARLQPYTTTSDFLMWMERAIQRCVENAMKKLGLDASVTTLLRDPLRDGGGPPPPPSPPHVRESPVRIDSSEKTSALNPRSYRATPNSEPQETARSQESRPSSLRISRMPNHQWEKHRSTLCKLYMEEGKPLNTIRDSMKRDYGFYATEKQYRYRFAEVWGWRKYNDNRQWQGKESSTKNSVKDNPATPDMQQKKRGSSHALSHTEHNAPYEPSNSPGSDDAFRDPINHPLVPLDYQIEPGVLDPFSQNLYCRPPYLAGMETGPALDPNCVFRYGVLDDCSGSRLYARALEYYLLDSEHENARVGCLSATCPARDFSHPRDMLRHLKHCEHVKKGVFWCPTCRRFELFPLKSGGRCSWNRNYVSPADKELLRFTRGELWAQLRQRPSWRQRLDRPPTPDKNNGDTNLSPWDNFGPSHLEPTSWDFPFHGAPYGCPLSDDLSMSEPCSSLSMHIPPVAAAGPGDYGVSTPDCEFVEPGGDAL